ncbi:MAG TPA: OsmC family peroxiredoxin [Longimicrobiales bacterium]
MPERTASAAWSGGLKSGNGTVKIGRAGFEGAYSFPSRFEEGPGMSPEDLIAGAHAACYSMAFAAALEKAGLKPEQVETTATATLETVDGAPTISRIHLVTRGRVPGVDNDAFQKHAQDAKANCPVSRLYKGAEISVDATLVQ